MGWYWGQGIRAMVVAAVGCVAVSTTTHGADETRVSFNDDIRPILAANCFACHGFDPSTRRAGLRLDVRADAIAQRDGTAAIVPGDPDGSMLMQRITSHDPHELMPPEGRDALPPEQVALLRQWIAEGATYDTHWSFKPIENPTVPAVRNNDWPSDDVDRFILARLDDAGLVPAKPAGRRTLIRRAYFDVIGLPPTPEQVEAFLADQSPDAFEQVVDELLSSDHFGERWARHWLDLMRYAETHGHEFDYPIHHAWKYRDYLIRAINADVPYDMFIREHIAGDLLPDPRLHPTEHFNESVLATGWWWLSQGTHSPVDVRADEAERIDNQIDVLSRAFLGLTVSCARCHDHKFDPIAQQDFYALAGFVQSSRRRIAYLDPGGRIQEKLDALADARSATHAALNDYASDTSTPSSDQYRAWLTAAMEVVSGEPRPSDPPITPEFSIFDDFEDGYENWAIEGTAFDQQPYTQPTLGRHQGEVGAHGHGFVNSHNSRDGRGSVEADKHLGRMVSKPFTIKAAHIHFLIGGGAHKGRTCINLVVDGENVRTATGRNSNRMHRDRWNVHEFIGREAHFEIIDDETGGWGHIGVDHITFSDPDTWREPITRPIPVVAREAGVDRDDLTNWVEAVRDERFQWLRSTHAVADVSGHQRVGEYVPFDPVDGMADGQAFGKRMGRLPGRTTLTFGQIANSGAIAPRLQGTWRSPTFELTRPYLHYAVMGRGSIRVIIDGYYLDEFNALLFEGMKFDVDTPNRYEWHMHTQPILDKYIGHRAYIEIIDDTDDWIAVTGIWHSDHADAPNLTSPAEHSVDDLAGELHDLDGTSLSFNDRWLTATNWMRDHGVAEPWSDADVKASLQGERIAADSIPHPMRALAITDGTPEDEYLFIRGDHHQLGDIAPRSFIDVVAGQQQPTIANGSGRLELADRLLHESNPLPARVMVNRVWQHVFGEPLVATPDDFGALGTPPVHGELLDALAHWFANDGRWSVKALIKRLMLTSAYQMSSRPADKASVQIDPNNTLLHRMHIKRLEGEVIRDAALSVSGRLDPTVGGPPIDIHLTPFMQGRGRPGRSGPLDGAGRRSIYTAVRRNFLSPMMLAFDTPVPHSAVGRRNVSNVPAQSLMLMNDPFFEQQADLWAKRLLEVEGLDDTQRVHLLYLQAFARPPAAHEQAMAVAFVQQQGDDIHASWAALCHVMFNIKEFIFVH